MSIGTWILLFICLACTLVAAFVTLCYLYLWPRIKAAARYLGWTMGDG